MLGKVFSVVYSPRVDKLQEINERKNVFRVSNEGGSKHDRKMGSKLSSGSINYFYSKLL